MGTFKEITGDLFLETYKGEFDVIGSGLNCFCTQGAGIIVPFKKYFQTDKFPMELKGKGDINKLGQIDYKAFTIIDKVAYEYNKEINGDFNLYVVNMYTQYGFGMNHENGSKAPFDEEAFTLCLRKINKIFKGKRIGLPAVGTGLAGSTLEITRPIMLKELSDCNVTLVLFEKQ